jgi:CTP:molybdopterin cytidylyltransferase MocA
MIDAILAAGGEIQPDDPLYTLTQGRPKALLPVAGRPMAQWVLNALAASPRIGRVVVIGLTAEYGLTCGDKPIDYIPSAGGLVENARAGLARVAQLNPQAKWAVWASADVPAVRAEHIDWLIETCSQTDHEFYYNVIERSVMEKRYPASRRTYTHLKDGAVCGGDVNVLATQLASADNPLWNKITLARKSVFRQAALIGFDTLLWLALRRLTLEQAEKIASERMGLRGRAIRCPYAEIGMDIDKPFQYEILLKELSAGG